MIDNLKEAVNQLSDEQAKSVLLQSMIRTQMIHEAGAEREKKIDELFHWQQEVLRMARIQHTHVERPYQTVHLVCGESPAGSLKVGLDHHQKVIGFPDFFGDGPISDLHQISGQKQRVEWLNNHLNMEDDYYENEYEKRFVKTLKEIADIPEELPIILWSADNADEQTGVRYFLYMMRVKENPVYLINSTSAVKELFPNETLQEFQRHTGGIEPESLQQIYLEKAVEPLTAVERRRYEKEWESLSDMGSTLRVWKNQQIQAVDENYYDSFILSAAADVTDDQEDGFTKAGRIIGEALGRTDDIVSAMFLEYRVRSLVYSGLFEIKGIPKSMRHYSVKAKKAKAPCQLNRKEEHTMKETSFSIHINASKEHVWSTLWEDETFRDWAGFIDEGTYMKGEMKEGNEMAFISSVNAYGVTSIVEVLRPQAYVLFRHLADTQESGQQERDMEWTGGKESYALTEESDGTLLVITMDVPIDQTATFAERVPKAMERIKWLAEHAGDQL